MPLTALLLGMDQLEQALRALPDRVEAGVKLTGEAVVRGLVWEYGRVAIEPGPKTMHSTNMDGEDRVLTVTAPRGWIRVNRDRYEKLLKEKTASVQLTASSISEWAGLLQHTVLEAAEESHDIMEETAPEDTGLLKASLLTVSGDQLGSDEGMVSFEAAA